MTQSAIATAADYADAMLTARRAKNILVLLILLILGGEIALFFVMRHGVLGPAKSVDHLKYLVAGLGFLGMAAPIVLSIDLLLLIMIMLVGRLIGVSRVVSAFLWCVVLSVLLFPWQAVIASDEFLLPGIPYTWTDLVARAANRPGDMADNLLFWARFVGWPATAIIIVLVIQTLSVRGLRLALGETNPEPIQPSVTP